jgi:hypothetical protein
MKKLILVLFLFIAGCITKAQTYQADTLVYFESVYNDKPDTILAEPILITISNGYILITKHNARFRAKITDTLSSEKRGRLEDKYFTLLKTVEDTTYSLTLILTYYDNYLICIGISHNLQLFIYHIQNQLISTYLKPKDDKSTD